MAMKSINSGALAFVKLRVSGRSKPMINHLHLKIRFTAQASCLG